MEDRSRFIVKITQYIPRLVTNEDNHNLNRPVSEEEVSEVIKEMQNGKAQGPDGFNVDFFKACLDIVKQDILEVVEDSRQHKKVLKALNTTFIALIPKKENVVTSDVFRPITLSNVVYKIISKVIANRLKLLLHLLISKEQTGYVEGRGLRKGDPISPFLFLLMMEGFGRAIKMENAEGRIQGIKLTPDGEANTHQQFVDDTMLQGVPIVREAKPIKDILNDFTMAVGTEVSLSKSKVFFFNTNIAIQRNITRILGFQREQLPSKYLEVPLTDKPLGKHIWEPILNKLQEKINNWTYRALNFAGFLVLTKAVLRAIPIFMLAVIPAPWGIKQQIRNIQRNFLWGRGEKKNKWDLVAWDNL
eukprot:PITA_35429